MSQCCVKNCRNGKRNGYRLFAVPKRKNALFRQPWLEKAGLKEEGLPKDPRICEGHFPIEAFTKINFLGWLVLKHDAVPTIFGDNLPMTVSSVVRGSEYAPVFQTPDGNWEKERLPRDCQNHKDTNLPNDTQVLNQSRLPLDSRGPPHKKPKLMSKYDLEEQSLGVSFVRREICCVSGCDNTARSSTLDERKFYSFPTAKKERDVWIQNIRMVNGGDWIPKSCSFVCPAHFDYSEWENCNKDLKLKLEAVPTLFTCQNSLTDTVPSNLIKLGSKVPCEGKIRSSIITVANDHNYSNFNSDKKCTGVVTAVDEDSVWCADNPKNEIGVSVRKEADEIIECVVLDESDGDNDKLETSFASCLEDISAKIKNNEISRTSNVGIIEDSVSNLLLNSQGGRGLKTFPGSKRVASLKRENKILKKELIRVLKLVETMRQSDMQLKVALQKLNRKNKELLRYKEYLKKMFNPDQIEAISRKHCKGMKWNDETIKECTWLKTKCGRSAYDELAKRLPIPSIRTLYRSKKSKSNKKESES